jgi:hypothetical protein
MLGMFNLLPLMKGWDYKPNTWTRELTRGQVLEVERVEDMGWLIGITLATDDCYGGCKIAFQGADLRSTDIANVYPQVGYGLGSFVQDPASWLQLYYRPNPQSSAGVYFVVMNSSGFQGSSLPYVPTTVIQLYLLPQSTQAKATVSVTAFRVVITDKKQFIRSLRAVMGMPTIQDIDPALLVAGTQEVTQKGEFDTSIKEEK